MNYSDQAAQKYTYLFAAVLFFFLFASFFCSIPGIQALVRLDYDFNPKEIFVTMAIFCGVPLLVLVQLSRRKEFRSNQLGILFYTAYCSSIQDLKRHWFRFALKYFGLSLLISLFLFSIHSNISYGSFLIGFQEKPKIFFSYWFQLATIYLIFGYLLLISEKLLISISHLKTRTHIWIHSFFDKAYYLLIILFIINRFID